MVIVDAALAARARRLGPVPYSSVDPVRVPADPDDPDDPGALPDGLAGWLAERVDCVWEELGRPDPFVVVDQGGRCGREVLAASLRCAPALRWLFVGAPPTGTTVEDASSVLGPVLAADPDEAPAPPPSIGPLAAAVTDLPAGLAVALVIAVGEVSRMAADRFEWRDGRWWEVRLAAGGEGSEVLDELLVEVDRPDLPPGRHAEGARHVDPVGARRWLARARSVAETGKVLVVDDPGTIGAAASARGLGAAEEPLVAPSGNVSSLVASTWTIHREVAR